MRDLDSFQLEMTSTWEGRETIYTVAWQRPDSFHVLSPDLQSQTEDHEKTVTDRGLFEGMVIGDKIYVRQCPAEGEECDSWQEGPRESIYIPMWAPELEPMWTIELLGLVSDAQIIGEEDVEGVACTRIQGRANMVRAMIQSWRRVEEERGPIYWGESCVEISDSSGEMREDCHEPTLDEYAARYEDSLREQDENPPFVEVWLGRDDKLMRRLGFRSVLPNEESAALPFKFSRFNEVSLKPPK
ncbi:MAG: hypothetical protein JSU97_09580 [Dehalococcoidia bacterium]|nr:MAG: hypothetical protein JSU97_09580 [Dehalococcoidia bacterium]